MAEPNQRASQSVQTTVAIAGSAKMCMFAATYYAVVLNTAMPNLIAL